MKKLLLIPALLAGSLALAQEKQIEISPMIGYNIAEGNLNIKDDGYLAGGVEVQINNPDSKLSPELSVLYSSGVDYESGQETKIIRGALNGVYTFDAVSSIVPFAKCGFGFEKVTNSIPSVRDGLFLDAGAGLKVPFTENLALKAEAIYMAKAAKNNAGHADSNLVAMVGLTFTFGDTPQKTVLQPVVTKAVVAAPVVVIAPIVADDDNDGVVNTSDSCLNTPTGVTVASNGCELDDDNDGVSNSKDSCPSTVSGAKVDAQGCNIDTDNDGILNTNDLCKNTVVGAEVNSDGCPKAVHLNINFENNSDKIKVVSQPQLQEYSNFLKTNKNYSSQIIGYTDSRGSASYNQKLSQKRAESVVSDLISKGVDANQLSSLGKGEQNPIAENTTAEGRAQNRRIDAKLIRN